MKYTNLHEISLPLAVWLLFDEYDYVSDTNYISTTSLLKSTKQILLSKRIKPQDREADISDFIAARFGHSVHDSVEKAWMVGGKDAMLKLGYPQSVVNRMVINPSAQYLKDNPDTISVYIELRTKKEVTVNSKPFTIGGKFDIIIDGRLFDTKTTSVWSYMKGSKDEDYAIQMSIYRWLNPELVTEDHGHIQFVFTDWQKAMTKQNPDYPKIKLLSYPVELHSIELTEKFIVAKISELLRYWNAEESQIPECTDKELWRSEPQYKYYTDPAKANDPAARSTKNFDNLSDAKLFQNGKGGVGIIKTIPGEVKACAYCPAFDICEQRKQYFVE